MHNFFVKQQNFLYTAVKTLGAGILSLTNQFEGGSSCTVDPFKPL